MRRLGLALAALALIAAAPATVRLSATALMAKDFWATPRILAPSTPQTAKINAALDRADGRARKLLTECKSGGENFLERGVSVDAYGPRFLSLFIANSIYCGGAHPETWQIALTYDLTTGRPIDWAQYLPADLVSVTALEDQGDGSKIGVLKSPALLAWYRAAVAREGLQDNAWWAECKDVYDTEDLALVLWIDAKQGGVMAQASSLPHAVQACVSPQMLSIAELRKRGAKPALADAIAAMQRARGWRH
ncbi:hypothetical protein QO010_002927 [Caulobacter ginsengisoli]|uniref:Methanolan biosynthesis EpsI domain-containing protein n=1 Tax=Caulobacter ginsengisoli TaxID=400775 RepID=A0ABU0IT14_9CAUL|nr:hypothetical protein [Caulobacter ginsengisoli]MDQ0465143.1 hypothetical protein [Caulobacter ginsengisoli]